MGTKTIVHLLRHGEVYNPDGILYGRRDGFMLSARGREMARVAGDFLATRDITHLVSSPLERAQETSAPLAAATGLEVHLDERVLESENKLEGLSFKRGARDVLTRPKIWRHMYNPMKPSWGESYVDIASRMMAAVHDARQAAEGHEAVVVSHQLPIWTTRLFLEKRSNLVHPKRRQCTLCSVTSLHFEGDTFTHLVYSEPAGHLISEAEKKAAFSSGSSPDVAEAEEAAQQIDAAVERGDLTEPGERS